MPGVAEAVILAPDRDLQGEKLLPCTAGARGPALTPLGLGQRPAAGALVLQGPSIPAMGLGGRGSAGLQLPPGHLS